MPRTSFASSVVRGLIQVTGNREIDKFEIHNSCISNPKFKNSNRTNDGLLSDRPSEISISDLNRRNCAFRNYPISQFPDSVYLVKRLACS